MKYPPLSQPVLNWETNFSNFGDLIEVHIGRVAREFHQLLRQSGFLNAEIKLAWLQLELTKQIPLFVDADATEIILAAAEDLNAARVAGLAHQLEDLMAAVLKKENIAYVHPRALAGDQTAPVYTTNGLRLDVNGFLHNLGSEKIKAPSPEQTRFYLQQINKALNVIGEISPQALSLIETFTHTIHLRENPHHPNYASWSTHTGIGKIAACNFGYIAKDLAEVIDFLIHESIHNFLHLVEEKHGPFLEPEAYQQSWLKEKIVASPWSGERIDLGSYTHAIAVWFGLAKFWIKALDYRGEYASELKPQRIEKMIHQASRGFVKNGSVHLAAGEKFGYLNKDYLSFSLGFQSEINHYWRGAQLA